jgi:DNA-binding XRE family transcriptional regulator
MMTDARLRGRLRWSSTRGDVAVPNAEGPPEGMSVAEWCAELRKRSGFTHKQLGEHLGIAWRTWYNWERGDREPRGPSLKLIVAFAREVERMEKRRAAPGQEAGS